MKWLNELYSLVSHQKTDEALDLLFDNVLDSLFENPNECNEILKTIEVDKLDTTLLVGILSTTWAAKDLLPFRPELVKKVEDRLKLLAPTKIEGLIGNLR